MFDPNNECAREMLLKIASLLNIDENDEIGIVCNFIDSNQDVRIRFSNWLENYETHES